jgi:hypothetical protein
MNCTLLNKVTVIHGSSAHGSELDIKHGGRTQEGDSTQKENPAVSTDIDILAAPATTVSSSSSDQTSTTGKRTEGVTRHRAQYTTRKQAYPKDKARRRHT